jgi:predicted site-specific integrase-resolvase
VKGAAIYARVSSYNQKKEEQSVASQTAAFVEYRVRRAIRLLQNGSFKIQGIVERCWSVRA